MTAVKSRQAVSVGGEMAVRAMVFRLTFPAERTTVPGSFKRIYPSARSPRRKP